jgi:hypothetical protein
MPVPQRRLRPIEQSAARVPARVAADGDGYVASPVHRLQASAFEFAAAEFAAADVAPVVDRYPGWVRLMLPLVLSGGLWAGIVWLVRHWF